MLKISDAVREIVDHEPVIRTALAQRLLNLSRVARYLRPAVEARTQKTVRPTAIAMALSRLQGELPDPDDGPEPGLADRVTVQRGLAILSFPNTRRCHEGLLRLQEHIRPRGGYLTITEGIREVTVIVEERMRETAAEIVAENPTARARGIASLSVSLAPEDLPTPGVLYRLLQPLALQGINLAEVTSTTREFHLYLGEADVMAALDALYAHFGR